MIVCRICGDNKPEREFTFRKDNGKYRTDCDACRSSKEAARRYGITVGDVDALKAAQNNRCAVCGIHADEVPHSTFKHNPLVIDHAHATGKVRGLLCPTCNVGIGHFKDDPELLASAADYLRRH